MKKTTKSTSVKKARIIYEGKPRQKGSITTIILSILIIILAVYMLSSGTFFLLKQPLFTTSQTNNSLLVTVNNEPIYSSDLDEQWNALPLEVKKEFSRADVLDKMVEEQILLQEARQQNITVTDEEVAAFIEQQLVIMGLTPELFAEYLDLQGVTKEEITELYREQLTILKLFEKAMPATPPVSDEAITAYYTAHQTDFFQKETTTIRHLFTEINEQFNESQAQERVNTILGLLKGNFSNYCALVANYSMDLGSAQNCGEYTFVKGELDNPTFDASFAMDVGTLQVFNSSAGIHIMLKTNETPAKQLELNDQILLLPNKPTLKTLIADALREEEMQAAYETYVATLVAKSNITYEIKELTQPATIALEAPQDVNNTNLTI
ncbi:SurA N-terminal domain-containing protein [Candidatus Woesearchaeota archaeon]|nr:SurA N-terminal domain-containing protein [Candidatus Woesearchaeota archaeon]